MKLIGSKKRRAFTIIELLVILIVVAVIAATLLPSLANTKIQSQAFHCQSNLKRLTTAWMQYSVDNEDNLMISTTWVGGGSGSYMTWGNDPRTTNIAPLLTNYIGAYVQAPALYKCPADRYQTADNPGPRVRSVSMNDHLGRGGYDNTYVTRKLSDLNKPGPAMIYVLLDEQADSIDDGNFAFDKNQVGASERWLNLPGSYHNSAGSLSFADGHTEIHKWQNNNRNNPTLYEVQFISPAYLPPWDLVSGKSMDYEWMNARMPYR